MRFKRTVSIRVTRCCLEKIAQNVAQPIFCPI
jgi:hypothetical protein